MNSLTDIGRWHGTDKINGHTYLPIYENYLDPIRHDKIRLLEIGYGGYESPDSGGEGARMFREYFTNPETEIVVMDIYPKNLKPEDQITFVQGSQTDPEFLQSLGEFDVIVDDGSHMSQHIIFTFSILFNQLKPGGIYIIEDTQTSYWKDYSPNMPATEYFKSLTDGLNYREVRRTGYKPTYFDEHIFSIHFYHNLIIMIKGDNTEPSNIVPPQ